MTGNDLHDLLDRAVEPLDTMPDAVPGTLVAGRRSVRRRRAAAAAGTVVGAAAGVAAVIAVAGLAGGGTAAEPPVAGPVASPTTSAGSSAAPATKRPSHRPSKGGKSAEPWTPPADLVAFNRDVLAPALSKALPDRFGDVTVAGAPGEAGEFRVSTGGQSYELQFYVNNKATGFGQEIFPCSAYTHPGPDAGVPFQFVSCAEKTLPTGVRGVAYEEKGTGLIHRSNTIKDDKMVEMSLYADGGNGPISNAEMLAAMTNADLTAAYQEWMTHPTWLSN